MSESYAACASSSWIVNICAYGQRLNPMIPTTSLDSETHEHNKMAPSKGFAVKAKILIHHHHSQDIEGCLEHYSFMPGFIVHTSKNKQG
jgi:hypothetical protein